MIKAQERHLPLFFLSFVVSMKKQNNHSGDNLEVKPKFLRWLQLDGEEEKIKRCENCAKKINFKYYSIWYAKYTCKCGKVYENVWYKAKKKRSTE